MQTTTVSSKPSLLSANLLYLLSMGLIVTLGAWLQGWSFGWGLILTELLLILLPTLLFIRLTGVPLRATLRLRWPGWPLALLGALVGAGLWPLGLFLETISATLFGYVPSPSSQYLPATSGQAVVFFAGLALCAPLCEEALFRGYLQRAYERRSARAALWIVFLLFAFFHQRLQGLLALLPIAWALGYLAQRSNSLVPGILAHFANNGLQAGLVIGQSLFQWDLTTPSFAVTLGGLLFGGLLLAALSLWLLGRLTRPEPIIPVAESRPWYVWAAPLLVAAALYSYAAWSEWAFNRAPARLASPLTLQAPAWEQPAHWTYEIRDRAATRLGEADCRLKPDPVAFVLTCHQQYDASEVHQGNSSYYVARTDQTLTAWWQRDTLHLIALESSGQIADQPIYAALETRPGALALTNRFGAEMTRTATLSTETLLNDEWPWRLAGLPFAEGFLGRAPLVRALYAEPQPAESYIRVPGTEPLTTPAGDFTAWKVTLTYQTAYATPVETAWYDVVAPHPLLKYDNGVLVFTLTGKE